MTSIPPNLPRVPNLLASQILLGSLGRTNQDMLNLQVQLASGERVGRTSDDALAASAIIVLDDILERRDQRLRNLSHADAVMNNVDAALAAATDIMLEAKGLAVSQIGVGGTAETRNNQADVIDAMLTEMVTIANREFLDIHLFAGVASGRAPMSELLGGLRYSGRGEGVVTDLGQSRDIAITTSGEAAFGALSARVEGDRDLDPGIAMQTRLKDLGGAQGMGVRLGSVNVDVSGTDITVDLAAANTVENVIDMLQASLQVLDPGVIVQIDPVSNHALEIVPSGANTVTITDPIGNATAADLGLDGTYPPKRVGPDLNARMTTMTALSDLSGLTLPLGVVRLTNGGQTRDVDLSGAQTVQDIVNAVEATAIGVRVVVAESGDRLTFVNEVSGAVMSVGEVGGGSTATDLGVRTLAASTLLSDFNDGRGVEIISGNVDPLTGMPDPARDLDLQVELKDGRTFDVDLAGAATVQDVLDMLNAAAATAGIAVPAEFQAGLAADGNGIVLSDGTVGGSTTVTALNGSKAAGQLGILGATTSATLVGEDRAMVAVDSVFSHLIELRDALRANDELGITLAGERLEVDLDRLARTRGEVGVRARRVADAVTREEELRIQETALRSNVQDLEFTEAALRFATLQRQLEAGFRTASQVSSLSLLDFLG
jgi:flagellin-like hook-associated protein FlgL